MHKALIIAAATSLAVATHAVAPAQGNATAGGNMLKTLVGKWEGTCQTWLEPGKLADKSEIRGEFTQLLDGRFIRHRYESAFKGKPRSGEETIVHNTINKRYEVSWFDSFHMNYGILFSEGDATANGFSVRGSYSMGPGQPSWGWKTVFEIVDENRAHITAYNITPEGQEAKAVETIYTRVGKRSGH